METHPDPDAREEQAGPLPALVIGVIGLYLAGFAAIVLDERVFQTFVLHNNAPEWAGDLVGVAYRPLIQLIWLF
jgi:hypothetical protein